MTQLQMVIGQLNATGEVTRNWCLARYCSRLGARIDDLEKQGWIFRTEKRDGDYVYQVIKKPEKVVNEEDKILRPEVLEAKRQRKMCPTLDI